MKEATENLIHPARPGDNPRLGDFGYFKNGQWHRMGNIETIKGYRFKPKVNPNLQGNDYLFCNGVSFSAIADAEVAAFGNDAKCKLKFSKSQNFYLIGRTTSEPEYESIKVEVAGQIEKLEKDGILEPGYCVVVKVYNSNNYLAVFSNGKDCEVGLTTDLTVDTNLDNINAGIGLSIGMNKDSLSIVNHLKHSNPAAMGFKTVTFKRSPWNLGLKKELRYVGEDWNQTETDDGPDAPEAYENKE